MQGYPTVPGAGLFQVGQVEGETRRIAGFECTWREDALGGSYIGAVPGACVLGSESPSGAYCVIAVGLPGDADYTRVVGVGKTLDVAAHDARLRLLGALIGAALRGAS